jgi:hypothetical protein
MRFLSSSLWLRWTLITLVGFFVGAITGFIGGNVGIPVIGYPLAAVVPTCTGQGALGCMLMGAVLGAGIGLGLAVGIAQWLILRRIVQRSYWWILASIFGWCGVFLTLTIMVYTAVPVPGSPEFEQPILARLPLAGGAIAPVTIAGALMGLFQWLILRGAVRQSWLWILAHAVIMLLAGLGVFILGYNIGGIPGIGLFIVSFSPIYAVLSGSLLNWLMQHRKNPVNT